MAVDRHEYCLNGHFDKQRMDFIECQLPALCSPLNLSTMYFFCTSTFAQRKKLSRIVGEWGKELQETAIFLVCCINKLHVTILTVLL